MKAIMQPRTTPVLASLLLAGTVQAATLTGSVRTAGGDAIKARISILSTSESVHLDTRDTDADGTFSFEVPSSGLVVAAAAASGYASHEISLSDGVPSGRVTFTLHPLQEVSGTVTDSRGRNVAGVQVRVRRVGTLQHIHLDHYREAVTDSDGSFTVKVPGSRGRYVVDAATDGWVPQSSGVIGSDSRQNVLVSLDLVGASVSGKVTSPSGSNLSGTTVLVGVKVGHSIAANDGGVPSGIADLGIGKIRPYGKTYRARAVTDSRGRYEFTGLPPGNLGVVAIKRRVRIQPQRFQSVEGGSYIADFVIPD